MRPDKSDLIDSAIGELSMFHQAFGYYAHGVDDTTATLPAGWAKRLVPIHNENTAGATAGRRARGPHTRHRPVTVGSIVLRARAAQTKNGTSFTAYLRSASTSMSTPMPGVSRSGMRPLGVSMGPSTRTISPNIGLVWK